MTIRIAFPYRLRHGQRNSGLLPGAPGRVRAWVAVKTKAWSPQFRRWRRVLVRHTVWPCRCGPSVEGLSDWARRSTFGYVGGCSGIVNKVSRTISRD